MKGMLDPEFEEKVIGEAIDPVETFKVSKVGTIGWVQWLLVVKSTRDSSARVIREVSLFLMVNWQA